MPFFLFATTLHSLLLTNSPRTMVFVPIFKITCIFTFILIPIFSQQSYDKTNCTAIEQVPGSNYLCNTRKTSCDAYILYRAQPKYQTLTSIATLFDTSLESLLSSNNISNSNNLKLGQELLVPVQCTCPDRFSYVNIPFNASNFNSFYEVACVAFEGLVKEQILLDQNRGFRPNTQESLALQVPIRCACPDDNDITRGIRYLVTYPVVENDHLIRISNKFGVRVDSIFDANGFNKFTTIFPHTTILIPTKDVPVLNIAFSDNPAPSPRLDVIDVSPGKNKSKWDNVSEYIEWVLIALFILLILGCGIFIFIRKKKNLNEFRPLSDPKLMKSSPDLIFGMSQLKHSLVSFSIEELKFATEDFSEANVIGKSVYKARIRSTNLAIEHMSNGEGARHVISILTKINHLNVVKLVGCCYNPVAFLVYEFAENGNLRDCLSNVKMAKQLNWEARMKIAFDLAVGLHYLHHCTKPTYVHRNINSRNVLVTCDLRAKISGFRLAKAVTYTEEEMELNWNESVIVGRKGYLSPEYVSEGRASTKIDVYAFGVVLLELLSANVVDDGKNFKDSIKFLDEEALRDSNNGCLEKFKRFMDPALEGDYPLGDAMCLALLAMGCLDEDPFHRPNMNDALKALSRFI